MQTNDGRDQTGSDPAIEASHEFSLAAATGLVAISSDPYALQHENEALRAEVGVLRQELAAVRASAMASDVSELGRSLLYYVLDVICALLHPQRGSTIVADTSDHSLRPEAVDRQLVVGPMQMVLERPCLERAIGGKASRLMTRYESVLWLPVMHGTDVAVVLCLRRSPNSPYSIYEQEMSELLAALIISSLQTGRRLFELHDDPEALRSLANALGPCIRAGGGRVATQARDAERLARNYDLSKKSRETIRLGAILHDIGTVDLAEDVLNTSRALSKGDFDQLQQHPAFGAEIVRQLPGMEDVIELVSHHHERWDGYGYPDRLVRTDIPLGSRIIAVVDAFHNMISPRAFQVPRSVDEALKSLLDNAGTQFDPEVVEAFLNLVRET
jgi:putative nucleotidyltransferase with HDIG domain